MSDPILRQAYKCSASIRWVREVVDILVVDERTQQAHVLSGEEAAVWDWLMLGYSYRRLVTLLAAAAGIAIPRAEARLRRTLEKWMHMGLLEIEVVHG